MGNIELIEKLEKWAGARKRWFATKRMPDIFQGSKLLLEAAQRLRQMEELMGSAPTWCKGFERQYPNDIHAKDRGKWFERTGRTPGTAAFPLNVDDFINQIVLTDRTDYVNRGRKDDDLQDLVNAYECYVEINFRLLSPGKPARRILLLCNEQRRI